MPVPTTMWAYPWDLLDEGIEPALDRIADRAGATGVAVATVYHAGKFLHPNNPRRKITFPRSGTLYFPPDPAWYGRGRITPPVWPQAAAQDFWPELRRRCHARGLELTAWTLCLHNSGVGQAHPDCTVENAFGDRIPTDLCAAHPDVRDYVRAVTRDISRTRGVDKVLLESLEYMPFQHGFHHEVVGVPVGPTIGLLLSLCFCRHCARRAETVGVDAEQVREWVATRVETHFAAPFAGEPEWSWDEIRAAADGQLGRYLDVRRDTVSSLSQEVVEGIREESEVKVAVLDFGPLYPHGPDGSTWESGTDLGHLLDLVDEVHPTFYFTDLDVHKKKVDEYVALLAGRRPLHGAIRAILPQTASADDLAEQVRPLSGRASGLSFYNYGFMARQALDWIRSATTDIMPANQYREEGS